MERNKDNRLRELSFIITAYLFSIIIPLSHSLISIPIGVLILLSIAFKIRPREILVLAFLLYISGILSGIIHGANFEELKESESILILSTTPLIFISLKEAQKERVLEILAWFALIPLTMGLLQKFTGLQYPFPRQPLSDDGFLLGAFTHHNQSGGFYGTISLLFLYKALKERNIKYAIITTFNMLGLVLSFSRSAYISFTISLTLMLLIMYRMEGIKYALAVTGLIALTLLTIPATRTRIMEITRGSSLDFREYHWKLAITTFKKHPLLGTGFGSFRRYVLNESMPAIAKENWDYPFPPLSKESEPPKHFHNTYLTLMAKTGLIGIIIFIALWVTILRNLYNRGNIGGFIALISILILSLFDHNLRSFHFSTFVYFLTGNLL